MNKLNYILILLIPIYTFGGYIYGVTVSNKNVEAFNVTGNSMVEFGINDTDIAIINRNKECKVGDTCVFTTDTWKVSNKTYIKKLISREDNCYYFEGNPSGNETGDSRQLGCIPRQELRDVGRVDIIFPKPLKSIE